MNKPIYLGQSILDLNKTLMYEFYYEYLKLKYRNKKIYVTGIQTALSYKFKQKTFTKILLKM